MILENSPSVKKSFNVMAKPAGPLCNLDCTYCFYLEKKNLYPSQKNFSMPLNILEKFIRQYIEGQDADIISFTWQGGEPSLLGVDYFKKAVKLQKKYADGKRIENSFQTNGILLNDEWCSFFAENKFLVGLSVDGPEILHNTFRKYNNGLPTFDKVMKGLGYLKKHNVSFNTLTVVNKRNSYFPLEVYNFLKEIGSHYIQFIPVVERNADGVTSWSVEPHQYGTFLCEIFDEWVKEDVGKYYIQIFDVSLESWLGYEQGLCVFNKTCGRAVVLEHNGDVFSCDHYVYPEYQLGNINKNSIRDLVFSEKQVQFGEEKRSRLSQYCLNCEVLFACNGGCPKNRFIKTPDGEESLNYLCPSYKKFFSHIDPYMKFMANEFLHMRPPANVMSFNK
jgi:uncharacterized protein